MLQFRRVVVGISGGVDSAVTALLLKNQGFDVQAVFMQNWDIRDEKGICKADEEFKDACLVCNTLGLPIHRVNFVKEYWHYVFSALLKQYESGHTPNPDILCNRFIKFDYFYHYAKEYFNADAIATGHYARTSFGPFLEHFESGKNVKLLCPLYMKKDQTLFLSQIKQEALRYTMFPLGSLTKPQVKEIASENGLEEISKKKESMGICFIGKRNFQDFISEYIDDKPGSFINVDNGKIIGRHNGIHQWTLGQRTKLDGLPNAMFTAKKNVATNDIYVAEGTHHSMLYNKTIFTDKPHWIDAQPQMLKNGDIFECEFKFQHVDRFTDCLVYEIDRGLIIVLQNEMRALTPGQYAVLYKNRECLGSAIIRGVGPSNFTLNLINNMQLNNAPNIEEPENDYIKNNVLVKCVC